MQVVVQPGGNRPDEQNQQQDPNGQFAMPGQAPMQQQPQMQNPQVNPQGQYAQPVQAPVQQQPNPQYQQPQQPQGGPFPPQAQVAAPQQQTYQAPQQAPQQPQQQQQQFGNRGQSRPVHKLQTRSGQPVQATNLVILEGYYNNPKLSTVNSGAQRLGFDLVLEVPLFEQGPGRQPRIDPNTGQQAVRNVRFRCQAWGNMAVQISQFPEGTPIKVTGSLNRWSVNNGGRFTWYTDVKVSQVDPL